MVLLKPMIIKYSLLILYFGVLVAIGLIASRKVKNLKDFYVGGKNLGYWVVAFSARATGESGWLLLGLTGMGALVGLNAFWVVLGEVLGVAGAWFFMARPFKALTDQYKSITIPDYLESRFKVKTPTLRIISAFILTVFVIIYASAQIDATGTAFESFLGVDYFVGATIGFVIVIAYTTVGGFVAVAWSDLFQGLMMLFGLTLLPLATYLSLDSNLWTTLNQIDPNLTSVWGESGFGLKSVCIAIGSMGIGLGFLGSPQVFVRFISIKNDSEIKKGRWVALFFTIITDSCAVLIGMLGRAYFSNKGISVEALGNGAQNVLPLLVENVFPTILIGLFIAIVLSAIMSTIDSLLIVASSALTRDLYQKVYRPSMSDDEVARLMRKATLGLSIAALALAMTVAVVSPTRTVYWFAVFGWSGIAGSFCPMMILSLYYKKYTARGAIASMIVGFLCVPLFKFALPHLPVVGEYINSIGELSGSFLLSGIAGILFSQSENNKNKTDLKT
jgi:sodium/proline symporter